MSEARAPCEKLREEPDWRPYCGVCPTMARMKPMPYGFVCDASFVEAPLVISGLVIPGRRGCGNKIGVDMMHMDDDEAAALTTAKTPTPTIVGMKGGL